MTQTSTKLQYIKIRYLALRKFFSKDFNCVGRAFIGEPHEFESSHTKQVNLL